MEPDPAQRRAIDHEGSPLLVVAGPGSGKTRVIVERAASMIGGGAKPSEILCLTFSDRAAREMAERLRDKGIEASEMDICTFHAFCRQVLEDNVLESGIDASSGIVGRAEQVVWGINNIDGCGLEHVKIGQDPARAVESIMEGIGGFKKELIGPDRLEAYLGEDECRDAPGDERDGLDALADLCRVYRRYQQYQRKHSLIDFDDMVAESIRLLASNGALRKRYQGRYRHVFVDEFQDNNYSQIMLVKAIARDGNVTAVGDDDQGIYHFQGARHTNFRDFEDHFKGTTTVKLERNYRSTKNIVRLANSCIGKQEGRPEKRLYSENEDGEKAMVAKCADEHAEAEFVAGTIREMAGEPAGGKGGGRPLAWGDFAVLTRRREDGKKFADALAGAGIPAEFTGEPGAPQSPIMRDLLANLRIAQSPSTAGAEIVRLLKNQGVPDADIARICHAARGRARREQSGVDFVLETLRGAPGLGVAHGEDVAEVARHVGRLEGAANAHGLGEFVHEVVMSISGLARRAAADDSRSGRRQLGTLRAACDAAMEYERVSPGATPGDFARYLEARRFEADAAPEGGAAGAVLVTTIHQSKGKEFPVVFVADVAANRLPLRHREKKFRVPDGLSRLAREDADPREIHVREERRLLYVAMTRARDRLFITYCARYGQGAREAAPSRFLQELGFEDNPLISCTSFGGTGPAAVPRKPGAVEAVKLERQEQARQAVDRMQLRSAVRKIRDLAEILHYEERGSLDGFDPREILAAGAGEPGIGHLLRGEREPLIDRESLTLSKSSLESYERCPLQFKFRYALRVPVLPGPAAAAGTAVHRVIEAVTRYRMAGRDVTDDEALAMLEKKWGGLASGTRAVPRQKRKDAGSWLRTFLAWDGANRNVPVAAEKEFRLEIAGVAVKGYIDRVERTPDGGYVVIDYKTGHDGVTGRTIKDDIQMNVYAMAAERLYGRLPEKAVLFYLAKDKRVEYEVSPAGVREARESIEAMVGSILGERFPAEPSYKNCKYCDFTGICDASKAA